MTDSSEPFTKASVLRTINKKCFSHVVSPGTLSNDDGDGNKDGKKSNRVRLAKEKRASRFFYTFLRCRCMTTM